MAFPFTKTRIKKAVSILLLALMDLVAFYAALSLAYFTRVALTGYFYVPETAFTFPHFLKIWWFPATFLLFIAYEKLYTQRVSFWEETRRLIRAVTMAIVIIFALLSIGKVLNQISRLTLILLWLYSLFVFPVFKLITKKILFILGVWKENVIIYGAGKTGRQIAAGLLNDQYLGYSIDCFIDDDREKIGKKIVINGKKFQIHKKSKKLLTSYFQLKNIEGIIIAIPSIRCESLTEITNSVIKYVRNVYVVPELKGISLLNTSLHYLFMEQLFLIKIGNNLKSWRSYFIKSVFDIVLSIILLPFLLLSILIISVLIKLDSDGPVFFTQERLGKDKSIFKCIKFRTMYVDSDGILRNYLEKNPEAFKEWEKYKKLKYDDPRVTRVGAFLRKTSLDELPQIFNVLKREMSLVGPRPYLPREISDMGAYAETILLTYPGLTGLWQVSGRNNLDFNNRLFLDSWYVTNWNLWFDLVLIIRTIKTVIKGDGAY